MKRGLAPGATGMILCVAMCAACSPRDRGESGNGRTPPDSAAALADSATSTAPVSALDPTRLGTPAFLSPEELAAIPEPKLTAGQLAALAPHHLALKDLGFNVPTVLPDTSGLKNRAKLQREWSEALTKYHREDFVGASAHFDRARAFHAEAKGADPNWPARMRNLEAALVYVSSPPGEVKRRFGEIADPDPLEILDVAYEWILLNDDLRQGHGREAVARLRVVQRSQLEASLEARKLMTRLFPDGLPEAQS